MVDKPIRPKIKISIEKLKQNLSKISIDDDDESFPPKISLLLTFKERDSSDIPSETNSITTTTVVTSNESSENFDEFLDNSSESSENSIEIAYRYCIYCKIIRDIDDFEDDQTGCIPCLKEMKNRFMKNFQLL